MKRHSDHYEQMPIQPYAIMRQMGILPEYLLAAAIKYIMRHGVKETENQNENIHKAITVLTDYLAETEVPF